MKQLVLKLDVNDEQDVNRALDRIARISGKYEITMDKTSKLCTVKGDDIDRIQIVRKLRMLCHVDIVEPPKEPEKKKEELVEVVVNASSLAAAVIGPSKEPKKKEDQLKKEEPTKQEEKKKGEEIITDVKEDPNKTFRAGQMRAVFKLGLDDHKIMKKVMKKVSSLPGVDSISMDMKDKKLTVVGDIDPVHTVAKLRKLCCTEIVTVGPAKEPEKKKEEPKKMEPKKQGDQKKKDQEPAEQHEDDKKDKDAVAELVKAYQAYNPYVTTHYHVRSVEEDPNACAIS